LQMAAEPIIILKYNSVQKGSPFWTIRFLTNCIHAYAERMLTAPYRIVTGLVPMESA